MSNVCVIRHQSYIKSKAHLPFRHNMRTLKNYSNSNIDLSLTKSNSVIENNLLKGETYLKAFNRLYESGAFTGQLKVQGDENKQTKYMDEFLVYPPSEAINKMTLTEQDAFFQKELKAIENYFPDIKVLSAVVHRDEVFHPIDEDMKTLFPEGKITPHMHITTIPIVHDKKSDCKKISISELWNGRTSYRKFQDYMYNSVGKEYGFDRGETHDFGEATKHLEVESFKLQEASKSLAKLESAIIEKEQEISERAKVLEPEEHITILNVKKVAGQQKVIHYALKQEKDKNTLLQKEKEELILELKERDNVILNQTMEYQKQQQKLSEIEKQLSAEVERSNDLLNIKISNEELRNEMINQTKTKIRLFDLLIRMIMKYLPELTNKCPSLIRDLVNHGILSDKDLSNKQKQNTRHDR
ncbi:MAG: mobilization protein [Anaerocolumna sp.]|nr:mobilization protein [Anaerocolumna sp.]